MNAWSTPWVLLLLLPWTLAGFRLLRRERKPQAILFAPLKRLPPDHRTWRHLPAAGAPWCWWIGLLLLILAAAGPQTRWTRTRRIAEAIAIQMVVDVSGSMDGLDLSAQPLRHETLQTRLDVVKTVFADFIRQRPDDLIGLTTFGGYASTRSPLTSDHPALMRILEQVEIPREPGGAQDPEMLLTAIGDALASATARLRNSEAHSRVVILLTDGESNAGILDPRTATAIAAELGIRIYVIGIGTDEPVPFLARDAFGRDTVAYAPITYDAALMHFIADETGGIYYNVKDAEGLERALESINTLETTPVEQDVYTFVTARFLPLAVAGALLCALGALGSLWWRQRVA